MNIIGFRPFCRYVGQFVPGIGQVFCDCKGGDVNADSFLEPDRKGVAVRY